jgi:hypothetical protein
VPQAPEQRSALPSPHRCQLGRVGENDPEQKSQTKTVRTSDDTSLRLQRLGVRISSTKPAVLLRWSGAERVDEPIAINL